MIDPALLQGRQRNHMVEFVLVLLGGLVLTFCAGYANIVVLSEATLPVTHTTGSVSRLSGDVGRGDATDGLRILMLLASFMLGATVSGLLIAERTLKLGRRYGVVTMLVATLLGVAAAALPYAPFAGVLLCAGAAGMQNAMASSYGGLIIRTTHMTGVMTDLGFMLGQALRGHPPPAWKPVLLTALLLAFFGGGAAGAVAEAALGAAALYLPAAGLFIAGSIYAAWRLLHADERGVGVVAATETPPSTPGAR